MKQKPQWISKTSHVGHHTPKHKLKKLENKIKYMG